MRTRAGLVLLVLLIAVVPVGAQENNTVDPDRPGVSTSAETLPRGVLQLETGVDYSRERRAGEPTERRTSLTAAVRYGLADGVELRLEGEPFVALRGAEDANDVGDISVGVKWRLLEGVEGERPAVAVLPIVKLPTAPEPIGTERPDFALLGLASFNLGRVSLEFNAGVAAIAQRDPDGYLVQALLVGAAAVDVTKRFKVLGEVFYNSRSERDGDDLVGALAGAVDTVARNLAIDVAATTTLAGRGPDYGLQAGITIRFGP